jgi:hypothetical protein
MNIEINEKEHIIKYEATVLQRSFFVLFAIDRKFLILPNVVIIESEELSVFWIFQRAVFKQKNLFILIHNLTMCLNVSPVDLKPIEHFQDFLGLFCVLKLKNCFSNVLSPNMSVHYHM